MAGVKVVFVKMSLPDRPTPAGRIRRTTTKEVGMRLLRAHPEYAEQSIVQGAWGSRSSKSWPLCPENRSSASNAQWVRGNSPDLVLEDTRYQILLVHGGAANVCVSNTLMDAFSHDYWLILAGRGVRARAAHGGGGYALECGERLRMGVAGRGRAGGIWSRPGDLWT